MISRSVRALVVLAVIAVVNGASVPGAVSNQQLQSSQATQMPPQATQGTLPNPQPQSSPNMLSTMADVGRAMAPAAKTVGKAMLLTHAVQTAQDNPLGAAIVLNALSGPGIGTQPYTGYQQQQQQQPYQPYQSYGTAQPFNPQIGTSQAIAPSPAPAQTQT